MMAKPVKAVRKAVVKHPAETAPAPLYGVAFGVLAAFGVDPKTAAIAAGVVAAVAPAVITWWKVRQAK
jgi:hypothetical protein